MKTTLAYGKKGLELEIPDRYDVDVVEPVFVRGMEHVEDAIAHALRHPNGCASLHELARRASKIGIIFSDITRPTPYPVIMPVLLEALREVPSVQITLFCATGTHRQCTKAELRSILGADIAEHFEIIQNDVRDPEAHKYIGSTRSGNEIYLHRDLLTCDLIIPTGFIEPHFFAGFSGGGKAVMPGMAALQTIRNNHASGNLSNPCARWGVTEGNPIWEEVTEAAEMAGQLFLLNITMNRNKEITGVFAGDMRKAHQEGCAFAKKTSMRPVPGHYDLVITSNSGYPLDLNVYQSVKGMSAAAQIVKPGGHIIIAAECWDGLPAGSDYEKMLQSVDSPGALQDYVQKNEQKHQDTWQVYLQSLIQQHADVYLFSDRLTPEQVRSALLRPVDNIDKLARELVGSADSGDRICVMPEGPHTIPYVSEE